MDWIWILLFILVGLVFIVVEIIAIPGIPIIGIAGGLMVGFGIFRTYSEYGVMYGNITLIISVLVAVLIFVYFLRSKTWKRVQLHDKIEGKVNLIDEEKITVGAVGKTISRLAPMGTALINQELVEVQTISDFIDEETDIEVVLVEGSKVVVRRKE